MGSCEEKKDREVENASTLHEMGCKGVMCCVRWGRAGRKGRVGML